MFKADVRRRRTQIGGDTIELKLGDKEEWNKPSLDKIQRRENNRIFNDVIVITTIIPG